jgi:hypothetical protein
MFSAREQVSGVASVGQEKFARKTQASKDTTSWPNIHQALRAVRRNWWLGGRNSRLHC